MHSKNCFNNHMGLWMINPIAASQILSAIRSGIYRFRTAEEIEKLSAFDNDESSNRSGEKKPYQVYNGVAVIGMSGVMMKHVSKMSDGVSTVMVRRMLRTAERDESVKAIMMVIDSPGGSVAGTSELASDVKRIDTTVKPVYAHIEDDGASAAYWVASQSRKVTANETAMIGSIGTVAVVHDYSKNADMQGVKVHVISTGDMKGAFTPGSEITEEQLNYVKSIVVEMNEYFLKAVGEGRGMDKKSVAAVADGRMFLAKEAKSLGLIDGIQSLDVSVAVASEKHNKKIGTRAEQADAIIKICQV